VHSLAARRTSAKLDVSGGCAGRAYSSVPVAIFVYESQLHYNLYLFDQMILETPRLILRSFQDEDIGRLAELMANRDFMRFSLGPYTREQTQTVLQKFLSWNQAGLPSQFAVIFRGNNEPIGYCGFLHWHLDGADEVEIGYRLHPDYWNRGLASEAAQAVRDHAFRDLNLPKVISLIHPDNIASRRVAEKNGMKIERETVFRGFPTQVFAITREQWLVERGAG
jgi:ribosomal-protein-alanine N-acetyltransferase